MKPGRGGQFTIAVDGIRYDEFARLKWNQFLRGYVVVLLLIAAMLVYLALIRGEGVSLSALITITIVLLGILALCFTTIRSDYRRSGLAELSVRYTFSSSGWTAQMGKASETIRWKDTHKVRRDTKALLLYPNAKSVNMVPMRCLSSGQLEQIIFWYSGKNK